MQTLIECPHGSRLVCPPSSLVDVNMILEVPTLPVVVVDNKVLKALRVELVEGKSDHEWKLELVHLEQRNEVQRLRAWIKELTIFVRVDIEYKS